jgi:hypothetical protein
VNDIKQQLLFINTKSQRLLKLLEYNIETNESLDVDEITQLQADRNQLISTLFEQYTKIQMHDELQLINEMVNLDANLQIKTEELKKAFADKLINIQKGKKSTLTYKKY